MKLLFISDIHGVKTNLDVVKSLDYDLLIFLGDLYYSGFEKSEEIDNNAVKRFLVNNRHRLVCVKGNCDNLSDYLNINVLVNEDYFKLTENDINIYCTHGHRYNFNRFSTFDGPSVLIYGHEHIPYIKKNNDMIYICVGSLSMPRYDSKASFCIYEDCTFTLYTVAGEVIDIISI